MPWKETDVMSERMQLVSEYLTGNYSLSELARRRGISRKTVYKWVGRFERDSVHGLEDLSRAPLCHPNAIAPAMERLILEWKARYPLWGAPKIHSRLVGLTDCPAESTVGNVLARHGLTRPRRRRPQATPNAGPLLAPAQVNQVWCADFKGWFRTGNGQRCDPLTISDAHSRYLLCCRAISGSIGWLTVRPLFEATFRKHGLPEVLRTDNGAPFASVGLGGLSPLSVWWLRLGIGLERIEPGHPEQNGRHERIHRTLKEAVLKPPARDRRQQQRRFDDFCQEYNHERPHESLGQVPPGNVYTRSQREYPARLLEANYPDDWLKRSVRSNGEIKMGGRKYYLCQSLIGQRVGLKPIADGQWQIYFMRYPLGILSQRHNSPLPLPKSNTPATP